MRCDNRPDCQDAVGTLKNRLQKGLDALGAAAYAVANMQSEPGGPGTQHCLTVVCMKSLAGSKLSSRCWRRQR